MKEVDDGAGLTRREAADLGFRFFSCKPCKHCGDQQRYVTNAVCVTCAKRRAAEHHKAFRVAQAAARGG